MVDTMEHSIVGIFNCTQVVNGTAVHIYALPIDGTTVHTYSCNNCVYFWFVNLRTIMVHIMVGTTVLGHNYGFVQYL